MVRTLAELWPLLALTYLLAVAGGAGRVRAAGNDRL